MKAIGLMAGTSLDGVDAALVELGRAGGRIKVELMAFCHRPYRGETVRMILSASDSKTGTVDQVARLNFYLGELFAEAALKVMAEGGARAEEVRFIGSHGQTIQHLPQPVRMGKHKVRATLQIGEPAVIAARTGVDVVADFRPADVAAGGEGAPLVPYVDYLLFRSRKRSRFLVNIGGVSNATLLRVGVKDPLEVTASDLGPGNMVIDELVGRMTNRGESFDRDGRYAARGRVDRKLLARLLAAAFFKRPPPKSTGRELFGSHFVDAILKLKPAASRQDFFDLIATATALTAHAIHGHFLRFHAGVPAGEVIVSGGGAKNISLMRMLAELFDPIPVADSGEYGVPARAKEAIAFAILGMETMARRPANLPGATGASRRAILGKIAPAPGGKRRDPADRLKSRA